MDQTSIPSYTLSQFLVNVHFDPFSVVQEDEERRMKALFLTKFVDPHEVLLIRLSYSAYSTFISKFLERYSGHREDFGQKLINKGCKKGSNFQEISAHEVEFFIFNLSSLPALQY